MMSIAGERCRRGGIVDRDVLVHDAGGPRIHHYEVRSTLRGHGFSHTIKNVFQRDPNQLGPSHVYGDGSYEWGGRLVIPEPPGTTHPSG
jgi:hypothetical protein